MTDVNTLLFILNSVALIGAFMLTFIASIFLHEMGHILILRKYSKKARVYFNKTGGRLKLYAGKEEDYLDLNNKQLEKVYFAGIFLGLFPSLFFLAFNSWGWVLLIIYLLGCKSDFDKIKQINSGN